MAEEKTESSNNSPLGDGGRNNMFYGANSVLFDLAEELRAKMTPVEEILWNVIKINEWHVKFRRQHPISLYIADFYCHKKRLVIEIDGSIHDLHEVKYNDAMGQRDLEELGLKVLRFTTSEIYNQLDYVLQKIEQSVTPPPPPEGGTYPPTH